MGSLRRKYIRCPHCGFTNYAQSEYCYRCSLKVKTDYTSINKSLAFLFTAFIFYIPANIYPILQSNKFFASYTNTIISGIFELWSDGDYPIAIIVFLASVLIPFLKFVILFYLNISVKSCKYIKLKRKLYKFIEISGPWSLLDVFVVFVLGALIHFRYVSIIPQKAALYFLLMVIFTILSAMSFDERLIGAECE